MAESPFRCGFTQPLGSMHRSPLLGFLFRTALPRSDLSAADGEALSEAEQKERAAAWLSACGVSVDGYAHCEAERFGDGSLLLFFTYTVPSGTDTVAFSLS